MQFRCSVRALGGREENLLRKWQKRVEVELVLEMFVKMAGGRYES
jgi:hypothetical protein